MEDLVWCRLTLGLVMLGLKGVGFVCAFIYSFYSSLSAAKEFVLRYAWPYIPFLAKRPADKFADIVDRVMLQVRLAGVSSTHSQPMLGCIAGLRCWAELLVQHKHMACIIAYLAL